MDRKQTLEPKVEEDFERKHPQNVGNLDSSPIQSQSSPYTDEIIIISDGSELDTNKTTKLISEHTSSSEDVNKDTSKISERLSSEREKTEEEKSGSERSSCCQVVNNFFSGTSASERSSSERENTEEKSGSERSSSNQGSIFSNAGIKRKYPSNEQRSSSSEEGNLSPYSSSQTVVPERTSKWTKEVLNSLQITITLSTVYRPVDIICGVTTVSSEMDEAAEMLKSCICQYMPDGLKNLDFNCVSEITNEHQTSLTSQNGSNSCWQFKTRRKLNYNQRMLHKSLDQLNSRFSSAGETFGRYLMYVAALRKKGEKITEWMYLDLFSNFLQMFGLYCYTVPAIPKQSMKIKGVNVVSTADLLLLMEENLELIAVCEVKKDFEEFCFSTPPKTRCGTGLKTKERLTVRHLDDRLIGQSGGELLLHYKSAAYKRGVLGLIIQKTYVTFTHLITSSEAEIDAIANGREINTPVSIVYSRPYNYLKTKDRMELIKPLLMLRYIYLGEEFS